MQLMLALARLSALRGHLLSGLRHACGTLDGNRCRLSQALVAWGAAGLRECRCCGCSTSSPAAGVPIHAEAPAAPPRGPLAPGAAAGCGCPVPRRPEDPTPARPPRPSAHPPTLAPP